MKEKYKLENMIEKEIEFLSENFKGKREKSVFYNSQKFLELAKACKKDYRNNELRKEIYPYGCNDINGSGPTEYFESGDNLTLMAYPEDVNKFAQDVKKYFAENFNINQVWINRGDGMAQLYNEPICSKEKMKWDNLGPLQLSEDEERYWREIIPRLILEDSDEILKLGTPKGVEYIISTKNNPTIDFPFRFSTRYYYKDGKKYRHGRSGAINQGPITGYWKGTYPFDESSNNSFGFFFCHVLPTRGHINKHPEVETLADLTVYLKENGHKPVLSLHQNPSSYDKETKTYVSAFLM